MASTSWLETPSAPLPPLPLVMWPGILQDPQPCRAGYTAVHMPNALNHTGSLTRPQSMWHESEFMMASAYQPAIYASIHPYTHPSPNHSPSLTPIHPPIGDPPTHSFIHPLIHPPTHITGDYYGSSPYHMHWEHRDESCPPPCF